MRRQARCSASELAYRRQGGRRDRGGAAGLVSGFVVGGVTIPADTVTDVIRRTETVTTTVVSVRRRTIHDTVVRTETREVLRGATNAVDYGGFEGVLETLRTTEDGYAIAHAMELLAHVWTELGRADEALGLLPEGAALIRSAGTPVDVARYRVAEARALAASGDTDKAAALAMQLAGELHGQPRSAHAYLLLGEIFEQLGDRQRAREVYELAVELFEQRPPTRHLVVAYRRLADNLKADGKRDEALELLERALAVQERVGRPIA